MSTHHVGVGDEISGFSRIIDQARMVMYAGATWDWHRLHYDAAYTSEIGLPGPIVDGQMFGALLAEHVLDYFGPSARLLSMSFRLRAMVFAGEAVAATGTNSNVEDISNGTRFTVDQRIEVGDRLCVTGTSVVVIPNTREPIFVV
jgi:acyl dehydratase